MNTVIKGKWSDLEIEYLESVFDDLSNRIISAKEVATNLNRKENSVRLKLYNMGLTIRSKEYALYKGDKLIISGTTREIAEFTGLNMRSISHYGMPAYHSRTSEENGKRLVCLDEN